jgi:alpha-tubulin suppressor-like RCC1 family protein
LEELQDLAFRLKLTISPFTTKAEICQMINNYVLESEPEPFYIDISTSRKTLSKMVNSSGRISAGSNHSLALTADGKVIGWGDNDEGQSKLPEEYKNLKFIAVSAGGEQSLALSDGKVVGWGADDEGQRKLPDEYKDLTFIAVSAGGMHSLALTNDGKVIGWGYNVYGQRKIPEKYKDLKFIAVSAGCDYSLGLTKNGRVVGWGC